MNNFNGMNIVANIRGGGEFGKEWHQDGVLEKKQNSFDDMIAGVEYLHKKKYTSPDKTILHGLTHGGLLATACANQRPDLFKTVIAEVAVTDMLRYHKFLTGNRWISEYGNS